MLPLLPGSTKIWISPLIICISVQTNGRAMWGSLVAGGLCLAWQKGRAPMHAATYDAARVSVDAGVLPRRAACCIYALQMSYYAGSNGTVVAATGRASASIAVVCNSSLPLALAPSDLSVRAAAGNASAAVPAVLDLTNVEHYSGVSIFVAEVTVTPIYHVRSLHLPLPAKHQRNTLKGDACCAYTAEACLQICVHATLRGCTVIPCCGRLKPGRALTQWCAQGEVTVQFSTASVQSRAGPRMLVVAAPLTYNKRKQQPSVVTTAAEYF